MDDITLSGSLATASSAEQVRNSVELLMFPSLLAVFVTLTALHGVLTSQKAEDVVVPSVRGPGGRPLPVTTTQKRPGDDREVFLSLAWRWVFRLAILLVVASFVANALSIAIHASLGCEVDEAAWWCGEEHAVYVVGSLYLHCYIWTTLFSWKNSPNIVHFLTWTLCVVEESVILIFSFITFTNPHHVTSDFRHGTTAVRYGPTKWEKADLIIGFIRISILASVVVFYACLNFWRVSRRQHHVKETDIEENRPEVEETTPLLGRHNRNGYQAINGRPRAASHHHRNGNGTAKHGGGGRDSNGTAKTGGQVNAAANGLTPPPGQLRDDFAAFYRPDKLPNKTWWEYTRSYSVFFPYLWPFGKPRLQLIVFLCIILVTAQRVVNVLVPWQQGVLVQKVANSYENWEWEIPYKELFLLMTLKLLQGPSGFLGSLRSFLWVPVSQYSYRSLTTAAFEHVHSLSLDFHLSKRTGEVLSALNKGSAINSFLEQTTFQVFPSLMDLAIAILFFWIIYGPFYGLSATIITHVYLVCTIKMASTRADQRRDMVNADREEEAVKNDSITSYETVKYFNAEQYEFNRYRRAIKLFQAAEAKVTVGMNMMNATQNTLFTIGTLVVLLTAMYQVAMHIRNVGEFVMIMSYLTQLQGPLNFFGTFYRTVQQALISGERLLELFKIQPSVVDKEDAVPLPLCHGRIRWNKVRFWYDRAKPALNDISFECQPGTTTAFVGESGGGKSTIFRLMFRYYNCHSGTIEIDGQDVTDLTIDSVRRSIGVVPQDTILFNETLMYNLKYANPTVSDEEVYEACRAASIHDRITSFKEGYDTKVGDRGLRLSGGEKQRVAIARAILKRPKIIMLDEATSALDSETEQQIQARLIKGNLGQDRTLLIIAHRLSTITHADQIIVLNSGEVVEKGTHEELLAVRGKYASMWEKQARAEEAAEEARAATNRANKLLRQANIGGAEHGDDSSSDGCSSMSSSSVLHSVPPTPGEGTSEHPNGAPTRGILGEEPNHRLSPGDETD